MSIYGWSTRLYWSVDLISWNVIFWNVTFFFFVEIYDLRKSSVCLFCLPGIATATWYVWIYWHGNLRFIGNTWFTKKSFIFVFFTRHSHYHLIYIPLFGWHRFPVHRGFNPWPLCTVISSNLSSYDNWYSDPWITFVELLTTLIYYQLPWITFVNNSCFISNHCTLGFLGESWVIELYHCKAQPW